MHARITTVLFMANLVCVETRLRGERKQHRMEKGLGLGALEHFGLDPNDYSTASSDAVFEPCDDVKTCLQLSVLMETVNEIDIFLQNPECTDVGDCPQGECRLTTEGFFCDRPGKLLCAFPCVENDLGIGNLP